MKIQYILIIFFVVVVLIFTFVIKIRNPITDLSIKYYNECDDSMSCDALTTSIFHKLLYNYIPLHYNTIFVIKTKQIYKTEQLVLYFKVFGFSIGDGMYVYLLISLRYYITQMNPIEHSTSEIISLSDSLISIPYLKRLYRYHRYNIILQKNKYDKIESAPEKSIILLPHDNELFTTKFLNVVRVEDMLIENILFTNYTITFEKHLDVGPIR